MLLINMDFDLDRITFSRDVMGGQACIRDIRVPVSLIINLIAQGHDTVHLFNISWFFIFLAHAKRRLMGGGVSHYYILMYFSGDFFKSSVFSLQF